jgi:hypothetical protein
MTRPRRPPRVVLGLIAAPGLAADLGERLAPDLGRAAERAWFVSSLATVDGALGAGLEIDVAVREGAYPYRGEDESPSEERR